MNWKEAQEQLKYGKRLTCRDWTVGGMALQELFIIKLNGPMFYGDYLCTHHDRTLRIWTDIEFPGYEMTDWEISGMADVGSAMLTEAGVIVECAQLTKEF